jgi:hypothetical protein
LELDLRQAREQKTLTIRHGLEAELLDVGSPSIDVGRLIDSLVPRPEAFPAGELLLGSAPSIPGHVSIHVSQQIIGNVQGFVTQSVQGTINLGPEAKELLTLVERFGGDQAPELESAVHEFEDEDARATDRLGAKSRIRAFLFQIGDKIEDVSLEILRRYVEAKLGL